VRPRAGLLSTGAQPAVIGRERDLSALIALLEAARSGRGSLVWLVGEGGIGKTHCETP
jgi:predicted ATPase